MTPDALAAAVGAAAPLQPERGAAARLAREELAQQVYQQAKPGWLLRLIQWAFGKLQALLDRAAGVSPGGYVGLLLTLLLVAIVVVVIRWRTGPLGRRTAASPSLFTARELTAAEHRQAADRHAAAQEWAAALRERLRAVIRGLEERGILDERPGRTALEAASDAGRALPECAADLRRVAVLFDEIWYGGRAAGPDADAAGRDLDTRIAAARTRDRAGAS